MIVKKIFSFAASSINLIIFIIFINLNSNAAENNKKSYSKDEGVVAIMYHRFNENKYPSTNIRIEVFRKHLELIEQSGYDFYNPNEFENEIQKPKTNKKILLTIDDGFQSFYDNAWPILKEKKNTFYTFYFN